MASCAEWYAGKNLFISGGSGFVGVCLLEKILRCIPDVGTIYLLLRPKRGKEIEQRLEDLKKNLIFERLAESDSLEKAFAHVKAIAGDVGEPDLGISPVDREILKQNVNIIFHSAATLDFAEGLKSTVNVNLLGTRYMLQLGAQCENLQAFVHVSSAYVNSFKLKTTEILYPLMKDPKEVIELVRTKSEQELDAMTAEYIGMHPNTYTFTKHMAEFEVKSMEEKFPCTIVRPSMIIGAWREPVPGWTISKNGPQGFLMGASKGVIRRLPVGQSLVYDYIPVDIVVNQLLAAGYYVGVTESKALKIYHCTSSTRQPFRWSSVSDKVNMYLHKYPLKSAVWYPHLQFLPTLSWFRFSAFFVHIIPAFILDTITKVAGGRPILMKLHRNVNASLERLEKFIFTEWFFEAEGSYELQEWLRSQDKVTFNVDITDLKWPELFYDLTKGVRRYLSNEKLSNLKAAQGKDTVLLLLHLSLQAGILGLLWFIVAWVSGLSMSSSSFIVPLAYVLLSWL